MTIQATGAMAPILATVPQIQHPGFMNAVALLLVLAQLGDFTGYKVAGANKIMQTINLFGNLNQVDLPTLMVELATIYLIITLEKTRLGALGSVVAMIAGSRLVPLFSWDSVVVLNDIAQASGSLPLSASNKSTTNVLGTSTSTEPLLACAAFNFSSSKPLTRTFVPL